MKRIILILALFTSLLFVKSSKINALESSLGAYCHDSAYYIPKNGQEIACGRAPFCGGKSLRDVVSQIPNFQDVSQCWDHRLPDCSWGMCAGDVPLCCYEMEKTGDPNYCTWPERKYCHPKQCDAIAGRENTCLGSDFETQVPCQCGSGITYWCNLECNKEANGSDIPYKSLAQVLGTQSSSKLYLDPNPVAPSSTLSVIATAIRDCSTNVNVNGGGGFNNCQITGGVVCGDPTKPNPKDNNPCWWKYSCNSLTSGTYTATFTSGQNSVCTVQSSYTVNGTTTGTPSVTPTLSAAPTKTPTPSPTTTPTPTPTAPPCQGTGDASLSFKTYLLIKNLDVFQPPEGNARGLTVDLLNTTLYCRANRVHVKLAPADGTNIYSYKTENPITGLLRGDYEITLSAFSGTLKKTMKNVSIDGYLNCAADGTNTACGELGEGQSYKNYLTPGDVNSDNAINLLDWEILRSHLYVSSITPTGFISGDVNFDGVIDIEDHELLKANFANKANILSP